MTKKRKKIIIIILLFLIITILLWIKNNNLSDNLLKTYKENQSVSIYDRNENLIDIEPNRSNYYAEYLEKIPNNFEKMLLNQEDKYFYYHPGINPVSTIRAIKNYLLNKKNLSSSTITQQLVKILLSHENERTLKNKIIESLYALNIEANTDKKEILKMYINSIYLGNKIQGLKTASRFYFNTNPDNLNKEQMEQLLAAIQNPSNLNPFSNKKISEKEQKKLIESFSEYRRKESLFEISAININKTHDQKLTIDDFLTKKIREIVKNDIGVLMNNDAHNAAVVVIKVPENEILAIVGSPDPNIDDYGYKINMAIHPRPIGSTIKPFIYFKGFEKGLRPYTFVEDKEYKYTISQDFAFYPKNYDYEYRGKVDLHYSLSNSLNIPTIKVLEYIELENFYDFLTNDLELSPVQDLENYQLGIALGGLEMDLLALTHYYTILTNKGILRNLNIYSSGGWTDKKTASRFTQNKKIIDEKYIQMINKILSDRKTGIEQFGMKSNLNLPFDNYAVKTGTSRDYHDSWTLGYTPDFLVGVWVGNTMNTPMNKISGQNGAGRIWQQIMNLLYNSNYNLNTPFNFNLIHEFMAEENIVYGLANDNYEKNLNLLLDEKLIINPHQEDTFLLEEKTQIPLIAREEVKWYINNDFLDYSKKTIFTPNESGIYNIKAISDNAEEQNIIIYINEE